MIRRYSLKRSDNAPKVGRKSYACSGSGLCSVLTGFPVTSAMITWASIPSFGDYGADYESMSSSSSSTSSSSSKDSSSSTSSVSNSSLSTSSSSSTGGVTSSSSSIDSSSSSSSKYESSTSSRSSQSSNQHSSSSSSKDSSSSSSFYTTSSSSSYEENDAVIISGSNLSSVNGIWEYNSIYNNKAAYTCSTVGITNRMVFDGTSYVLEYLMGIWRTIYKKLDKFASPSGTWVEGPTSPWGGISPCYGILAEISSSLSTESSSSSTSNAWEGTFTKPRLYIYDYISNGFRVKYENIPEEIGYIEFSYLAQ